MKSVRLAQIFSSERGGKPDAEWCSVEDLPTKCGQKRCAKMAVLNLSVLPLVYGKILLHEGCFERLLLFEELTEHQFRFVGEGYKVIVGILDIG